MSGSEEKYIKRAFDQNYIAPLVPDLDEFEKVISVYTGDKNAIALSSGTVGILLGLFLHDVERGEEVLVSTFSFSASVNPVVYLGPTPFW